MVEQLRELREERFFAGWDGFVPAETVGKAEEAIRALIDKLIALGELVSEAEVQQAVGECVQRFNELDDGWIETIEREDICECLSRVVEACGMDGSADWIGENRDW